MSRACEIDYPRAIPAEIRHWIEPLARIPKAREHQEAYLVWALRSPNQLTRLIGHWEDSEALLACHLVAESKEQAGTNKTACLGIALFKTPVTIRQALCQLGFSSFIKSVDEGSRSTELLILPLVEAYQEVVLPDYFEGKKMLREYVPEPVAVKASDFEIRLQRLGDYMMCGMRVVRAMQAELKAKREAGLPLEVTVAEGIKMRASPSSSGEDAVEAAE